MTGKPGAAAAATGSAPAPAADTLTDSGGAIVKTLDDLLALTKDVPFSTGRARAELAIRRLTAGEFGPLALDIRMRFREPGAVALFPRQVLNPLLRRWLAMDRLSAVEFAGCARGVLDAETEGPCYETLGKAFRAGGENFTRLLKRETFLNYDKARDSCIAALSDLPPKEALMRQVEFDTQTGYDLREHDRFRAGVARPDKGLAGRWAVSSPREAMEWALALPATKRRSTILDEMVTTLCIFNNRRDEALAILKETPLSVLPAGRLRERLEEMTRPSGRHEDLFK
jgi:hypothetical protein